MRCRAATSDDAIEIKTDSFVQHDAIPPLALMMRGSSGHFFRLA
jgi:hypothetical protein